MEPERAQHITLWAMAHGASPNKGWSLVRRAFKLSQERLELAIGRLQQQVEPYPGLAEELHYLQTAPLSELNSPRSPRDLAEYALYRYPTFHRCEAPPAFRARFAPEPTLEALVELGRLKRWWSPDQEEAVVNELKTLFRSS